ncbi:hypothetical protein [Aromatoleum toluvorans]|uniref:hypothetical protein n=1 Tax=Aromatoleum toluvorans TaxID=92002 RepID=UPI001B7CEB6C|nr:hypothetical protein [Aromatoleum toluvorans]
MLPFAIGAMVGAAAVRLLKTVSLQSSLDKAQERLREATISSLDAIEHSSAGLKAKLAAAPAAPEAAAPEAAAPAAKAAPARKAPARRRSTPPTTGTPTTGTPTTGSPTTGTAKTAAPRTRARKKTTPPADTGDSA